MTAFVHLHIAFRTEVYLHSKGERAGQYEAHLTDGDSQRRGFGSSPREAIIDAVDAEV